MNSWWNEKVVWLRKQLETLWEKLCTLKNSCMKNEPEAETLSGQECVPAEAAAADSDDKLEIKLGLGRRLNLYFATFKLPRWYFGIIVGSIGVLLIFWGAFHHTAPADTAQESEASTEMAVISGSYTPEVQLISEKEEVSHLSYQTMKEQLKGWVCEFGRINIRDKASFDGKVIDYVVYGDQLTVYEQTGEFSRVRYVSPLSGEIMEGYCYTEYISATEPEGAEVYLNVPLYKQADYRWGAVKIGGYETLASAGCTTSCIAMAETYMTSEEVYPDDVADMLYYTYDGKLTFPSRYDKYYRSDYLSVVVEKLHEGIPVLISGYTSDGRTHWVVIVGYSGDGEDFSTDLFMINDPGSYRTTLTDFMKSYPFIEKIVYYAE